MVNALKTVEQIYQSFGKGNIPAILDALASDVVWEDGAKDHGIPWLRPGRGKGHASEFFSLVGRELDIEKLEVRQMFVSGSDVVVHCAIRATVRSTGKTLDDGAELHVWRFGEDGKVRSFQHVVDTHQHWLASR